MEHPVVSLTAVYLKDKYGYTCFVEELPGVNAHGHTLEEARRNLRRLAAVVFDEERAQSEQLLEGKDVLREQFRVAVPRN